MTPGAVAHPALVEFRKAASEIHAAHPPGSDVGFEAIRPHFARLLLSGDEMAAAVIDAMLLELRDDPCFQSPNWDINQVLLEVNQDFALSVSILMRSPDNLFNTVADSYYGILGRNAFHFTKLRHPDDSDREIFDQAQVPVVQDHFVARPGEMLELRAGVDIIDWEITEPVVMLRYSSKVTETLQWTYARGTYEPQFAAAAMPDSTQLTCIAGFLGSTRHRDSLDAIRTLAGHPHHHVRWTAIRALCAIDLETGREAAEQARRDPHPHVRNAAERLIARLERA